MSGPANANHIGVIIEGFVAPMVGAFARAHLEMDRLEDRGKRATSAAGDGAERAATKVERLTVTVRGLVGALAAVATGAGMAKLVRDTIGASSNMEQLSLSIGTVISATNQVETSTGRVLTGQEKLNASLLATEAIMARIQTDALLTTATTEQLVAAFQTAAGPAAAVGFSLEQTEKFAVRAAQAMGALGIPLEQAGQELRSILSGDITADSRLAKTLGITNEQIREMVKNGKLFEGVMEKFADFGVAGEAAGRTFEGMKSSLQDVFEQIQRIAGNRAIQVLEQQMGNLLDKLVQVDKDGIARLNPELVKFGIKAGEVFAKIIQWVIYASQKVVEFMGWVGRNRDWLLMAAKVALVTAAIVKLTTTLGLMAIQAYAVNAVFVRVFGVTMLQALINLARTITATVIPRILQLIPAFVSTSATATTAIGLIRTAILSLMGPIGVVVAAIAAIGTGLAIAHSRANAAEADLADKEKGSIKSQRLNNLMSRKARGEKLSPEQEATLKSLRKENLESRGIIDLPNLDDLDFKFTPNPGAAAAGKAAEKAARERAQFIAALQDEEVNRIERGTEAKLAALDREREQGLISVADYYDRRRQIQQKADNDILFVLKKQAAATKAESSERVQAEGRVADYKHQATQRSLQLTEDRRKAEEQAAKAVELAAETEAEAILERAIKEIEAAEKSGASRADIAAKVAQIERKADEDLAALRLKAAEDQQRLADDIADRRKKEAEDLTKKVKEEAEKQQQAQEQAIKDTVAVSVQFLNRLTRSFEAAGNDSAAAFTRSMGRIAQEAQALITGPVGIVLTAVGRIGDVITAASEKGVSALTKFQNIIGALTGSSGAQQLGDDIAAAINPEGFSLVKDADTRAKASLIGDQLSEDLSAAARLTTAQERIDESRKAYEEALGAFNEMLKAKYLTPETRADIERAVAFVRGQMDALDETAKKIGGEAIEGALNQVNDLLQSKAEALIAFELGARDEAGRRISLERRTQLDIDKLDQEFAEDQKRRDKQRADLKARYTDQEAADLERIGKLQDEIAESLRDEEERRQQILNEGIAIRQKSVEEDKRDRIDALQDEGTQKRRQLNEEISKIKSAAGEREQSHLEALAQIDEEEARAIAAHENAKSRLKIELEERINAHREKMRQLDEALSRQSQITGQTQAELSALLEIARIRAEQGSGIRTPAQTANLPPASTATVTDAAGTAPRFYSYNGLDFTADMIPRLKAAGMLPESFQAYAKGGWVDGPAGIDKVFAKLTRGEFVAPAGPPAQIAADVLSGRLPIGGGGGTTNNYQSAVTVQLPAGWRGTDGDVRELARRIDREQSRRYRGRGNAFND